MPSSRSVCLLEIHNEIQLYEIVVLGSVGLCLTNVVLYWICFRKPLDGAPSLASQFFFVTGSMKIVMGILLAILFFPESPLAESCPSNCAVEICQAAEIPSILWSQIPTLIGLIWFRLGYVFHQRAQMLENGDSQGTDDTMFQQVPTVEVV